MIGPKLSVDELRNRPLTAKDRAMLRQILRKEIRSAIEANDGWEDEYFTWGRRAKQLYRIYMSVAAEGPRESDNIQKKATRKPDAWWTGGKALPL